MSFVELLRCSGKHFEWYIILYNMLKECNAFKQRTLIILKIFSFFWNTCKMQFMLHLYIELIIFII